jgi:prefoldin alpha subunit
MSKQPKKSEADVQQMFMQLQQIEEQARHLEQEAQIIDQKRAEFLKLIEQFDNIKTAKKGSKVFANIGAGVFAQAKLENSNEFLVNVGAGNFVKKTADEIKKHLKKQADELEKVQGQVMQNLQMLAIQGQVMQAQMQKE